ncbi:HNH endonuclease [Cohnella cholangitidis]|nr:HNH endonuclease [Cohnella cholangitidis]
MRPCNKIGCNQLARERYCAEHAYITEQQRAERHKHYDKHQRNQQATAFYHSVEWEAVRQEALTRDVGLCQDCLMEKRITTADVVDHIKPIEWFWELRLTLSNLRSLCHMHHNRKTAEDKRKYGGMGNGQKRQ